jgi:hypothetical protein
MWHQNPEVGNDPTEGEFLVPLNGNCGKTITPELLLGNESQREYT